MRELYIKYDYIKTDYEKTLEINTKCDFLFYSKWKKQYDEKTVYKLIERFYENANIEARKSGIGIHSLRSSMSTYLHSKGVALDTVIKLLGHIDKEIQNLYVYADKKKLKKLPKIFENV